MSDITGDAPAIKKRCFVVMGFGVKTDYATGRKLDLDRSYRVLIKPVVETKGLECVRADEIRQAGMIDLVMYQELLKADVVVADLSTLNANAIYELGIRHALRPRTTIVISENKLVYPFDLNHIEITRYSIMDDGIDYEEVERFRTELGKVLEKVLSDEGPDSPVYTFLNGLIPPRLKKQVEKAVEKQKAKAASEATSVPNPEENKTLALLIKQGEEAINNKEYSKAKSLFESALVIGKTEKKNADDSETAEPDTSFTTNDPYLIHRLVLATYKSQEPDPITALKKGIELLQQLDLDHTNDPETVTLAGAIEKKFYESGQGEEHLSNSILLFERGFFLLNNRYNGINLAYVMNCRANSSLSATKEEKIADLIFANRARKRVLYLCDNDWNEILKREEREAKGMEANEDFIKQRALNNDRKFWIHANRAEAQFGLGMFDEYKKSRDAAMALEHKPWMVESFTDQVERLRKLLQVNGALIDPPWKDPGTI